MHLVCDFDETLFDTNRLWLAWLQILVGLGVDRDVAIKQMEIINVSGWTHRAHAIACGVSEIDVDVLVENFLQHARRIASQLVYDDVIPFFQKYKPPHSFSVLTYGNSDYQHSKILSTGLQDYFDAIRVAGPNNLKVSILQEVISCPPPCPTCPSKPCLSTVALAKAGRRWRGESEGGGRKQGEVFELAFVDDSPNELNPIVDARLPIKLYRIVRPGARHDYWHERDDVAWTRIGAMGGIEM